MEPVVAILIMAFFYFYKKEKHIIAILFLALAAATKIYPILFVLIYVSDKRYKEAAMVIIGTFLFILFPLIFQQGGFEKNLFFILNGFELDTNVSSFQGAFEDKGNYMLQGSSLFSVYKILNIKMNLHSQNMLTKYFIFVGLLALISVFYTVFIEKILWKKVTILTCLIIVLPHISFDYKLIHVLYCVYLFINETKSEFDQKLNYKVISILFGVILIPKSYVYFSKILTTTTAQNDVPLGTFFNPILMIILCTIIIVNGLKEYGFSNIRSEISDHIRAIKKSIVYIGFILVLVIPYYSYSKKAKENYFEFKRNYMLSQENFSKGDKKQGLKNLISSFNCKPYKFQIALQIANTYSEFGKYDSAIVFFNKALQIFPGCDAAVSGILSIQVNTGNANAIEALNLKKYEEAEILFNNTIERFYKLPSNPNNNAFLIGLYSNLTVALINEKKWTEAYKILNKISELDPNNEFLKSNLPYVNSMLKLKN
ncbi:MAG: DUF2029 domain-containing protein [Bacteroidetes bacterium]|nr:DUF2029 domain-containing protein [Bacteroidota bacterium]